MFSKPSVIVTSVLITLAAALPHGYDSYPSPSVTTVYACMPPPSSAPISPSAPVSSAPISPSAPISSVPVSPSAPISSAPVSSAPVSSAPISSAPVSSAPVSSAPVSSAPISSAPVSSTPVSSAPITSSAPVSSAPSSSSSPTSPSAPTSSSTPTSTQCCNSVLSSTDSAVSAIAGLLGLDLTGLNVPIGLGCSPITVIGNNCGSTTVNCNAPEKEWGSLIAINCIPITL